MDIEAIAAKAADEYQQNYFGADRASFYDGFIEGRKDLKHKILKEFENLVGTRPNSLSSLNEALNNLGIK